MEINMETLKLFLQFLITPVAIFGILAWLLQKLFEKWISKDLETHKSDLSQEVAKNKTKLDANLETYKNSLQSDLESHKAKLNAEYSKKQFEFQAKFSSFHQKQFEVAGELFGLFTDLQYKIYRFSNDRTGVSELDIELRNFEEMFWRNRFYFNEELCGKIEEQRVFLREVLDDFITLSNLSEIRKQFDGRSRDYEAKIEASSTKVIKNFNKIQHSFISERTSLEHEFRKLLSTENSGTALENIN
jgi:hypothetical protein